jgi:filamentous hemagglutinin family protein
LRAFLLKLVISAMLPCMQATLSMVRRLRLLALIGCLGTVPVYAAGPSGGVVSAGSATITQSAAQTTIKQTSDKAVVNWNNFSIGSGSSVRFVQPSASSIALNRVTGTQASVIQGALQANGQVWVLNPNGVLIAPGGQVAAGSFLATTRSLTDQQFMAGNYAFTDGGVPGASVVNQGSIIVAEGGYAVLAGEAVRNEGYIEASLGQVVLGGAKAFTLDLSGDNTLAFVVTAPVDVTPTDGKAIVDHSGSIQAAGGRVLLTARAASQVVGQVINTGGVVAATSAQMVNGKIVLDGGTGSVSVAGNLNASGKGAGQTGGAIDVNAQKIQVKATAKLDVSGDAGGGKIAIGGGGPNTRTQSFTPAESTTIAAGALLDASALTRGDGGEILVFTSLTNPIALTQVAGSLIARGGAQGGNGGFIETSGYRLDVSGIVVSTNAPKGRLGLWLLDPDSIEIGAFKTSGGCTATDMTGVGCTRLDAAALSAALDGGGLGSSIEVSATNSILVSAPISWNSSGTLTLTASGTSGAITVNADITNAGLLGGLTLYAKTIDINARISLATGSLIVNDKGAVAGSRFTIGAAGAGPHEAQNIGIQAATVEINGAMTATDAFTITDASTVTIAGTVRANVITVNAPLGLGTITVEQPMVSRDRLELNAGTLISVTTGELTSSTGGDDAVLGTTTLTAPQITFGANLTQTGNLTATATTSISFGAAERITFEGSGTKLLIAPEIIWGAQAMLGNGSLTLQTSQLTWLAGGSYTGFAGSPLIIGGGGVAKTTITSPEDISLTASNITISNEVAWSGFGLSLSPQISPGTGNLNVNKMTGTGGASLVITTAATLNATEGGGLIALSGTPAPGKVASFTYNTSEADVGPETTSIPGGGGVTVTVTNIAGGGGGGGGGGGSGSSDTPAAVVTPVSTTTSTTAAAAAAKAAADAAAAKAFADAVAAQAAALDTTTRVVVEQAITQAVATVVASTSAAVFVAPPPPPPATTTTSGASTTTSTDTAATSSSASTTTTTTTAATTTTSTTTTATTATTATTTSTAQSSTVTQEFVEPLTVTTLSSTTSTVSDPGDSSAATTSTAAGPASQTATPASTASAAPAAPALTPVAVSKDGADAGDFTLQTVKPPAPVTTAKQEARPTERVTTTPVSPGIALQATQKTPAPSGSVLGREISGSGNSSNW